MAIPQKLSALLIINCGSSSLKASLFNYLPEKGRLERLIDASVDGIFSVPKLSMAGEAVPLEREEVYDLSSAFTKLWAIWRTRPALKEPLANICAVGHRVVHGGEYRQSQLITGQVLEQIKQLFELAPLHNPACYEGICAAQKILPAPIPHVAVFDTAFHHSLPAYASTYGLPLELSKKYRIRKYGFHGIAHAFLWERYQKERLASQEGKVITFQLGSGCSMAAIKEGISLDTTMGFTPLEGLLMATRCGDIDPAVMAYLCEKEGKSAQQLVDMMNFQSGLWGVSHQLSKDMQVLIERSQENKSARLAIDIFVYRIVKYIGAYLAVLKGVDALIFSGGIGENSPIIREKIISQLDWLGIKLERPRNQAAMKLAPGDMQLISTPATKAQVYVVGCDENFFIAEETVAVLKDKELFKMSHK